MISYLHRALLNRPFSIVVIATLAAATLASKPLHAQILAPEFKAVNEQYVNLLGGDHWHILAGTLEISEPLLAMPGANGDVQYVRYLSKQGEWRDNYKYLIDTSNPSSISVLTGEMSHVFLPGSMNIGGVDYLRDGRGNLLAISVINGSSSAKYIGRDGETVTFGGQDSGTSVSYPTGLTRVFYYKQKPAASPPVSRLQSVVQNDGTMIKYTYDSDDGASNTGAWFHVANVAIINQAYDYCDQMADHCSFAPNASRSASFTGPVNYMALSGQTALEYATTSGGYGRTYRRDMYSRIVGIAESRNGTDDLTISYQDPFWGVSQITNSAGDVRTYSEIRQSEHYTVNVRSSYANASDSYYFEDSISMPTRFTDKLGRQTLYSWSSEEKRLLSVTYPEGNSEKFDYDTRSNVIVKKRVPKAQYNGTVLEEKANYDVTCENFNTCNQPNAYIDSKGNRTDFTYASFGGRLSELRASPTPGAARPLKLFTYVQRTAYVLTSARALMPTGQPIWMPSSETNCQTMPNSNTLSCDPSATRTDTTYLYGANGTPEALLVHGKREVSGNQTKLTCYAYDRFRQKISETTPNANLQVCP